MLKALALSGAVSPENAMDANKIGFHRSARTDKGVHAMGQVVTFKMIMEEGMIERINSFLPPQIRVWGYARTMNNFNAKNHCDSRFYEYTMPTYIFRLPKQDHYVNVDGSVRKHEPVTQKDIEINKEYRCTADQVEHLKSVLAAYVGTNNHHNFTIGRKFEDKSSKRHIKSFEVYFLLDEI